MKTLYESILNSEKIDGHIHLFDHNGYISKELIESDRKCVCFADIAFRYLDSYTHGEIIKYYDAFIKNHLNPAKHILLATGITSEEIISIYKKYPQFIKGFGELKCYSKWKEGSLPYGDLRWITPLLEFNKTIKLPVYIHFNLDSNYNRNKFEELISKYHMFPIVLCHAGMVEGFDNNQIHNFVCMLLNKYTNLYIDISTNKTREFYINNPGKLLEVNKSRVILGTDINPIVKDVINNPKQFSRDCYSQVNILHKYDNFDTALNTIFNIHNDKASKLIDLYRVNFNKFDRHYRIHLLTRGNLIGMFSPQKLQTELKQNAQLLSNILDMFGTDNDTILNDYVLIGYQVDDRKKKIGELFKSVNNTYKTFLCLVTILEMTYTFQRVGLLKQIDVTRITDILKTNKDLLKSCIITDKYKFRSKASTKYINAIFFIKNLSSSFDVLNDIISDDFINGVLEYFIKLYTNKPDTTTIYGLTHILIGASNFYTQKPNNIYNPIINILNKCVCDNNIFNSITLDLQMEVLLCCKLFSKCVHCNMDRYISLDELEKNEHTNMLYILLNKYELHD